MLTVDDNIRVVAADVKDFSELTQAQQTAMLRGVLIVLAGKMGRPILSDIDLMFPGFIPR